MYRKLISLMIAVVIGFTTTVEARAVVLDTTPPIVTGVEEGVVYTSLINVEFNEGTALLNGIPVTSPFVVSKNGDYTLVATDDFNNETTVHFTMADEISPIVSGVVNNQSYIEPVTITFNEGTATLDGNLFESGTVVSALGVHKLIVIDPAENQTIVNFAIVDNVNIPFLYEVTTGSETSYTTLSWTPVANTFSYYIYSYNFTNSSWSNIASSKTTTITLVSLDYSKNYRFAIASYDSSVTHPKSNSVDIRTIDNPDTGKIPTNLSTSVTNYTDINLRWTAAELAKAYKVYFKEINSVDWSVAGIVDTTSYQFTNLAFNTKYDFRVAAILMDDSEYKASSIVACWTNASPVQVVTGINVVQSGTTGATVSWTPVSGAVSYHIVMRGWYQTTMIEANTTSTSYTFTNVRNDEYYEVKVSAIAPVGDQLSEGTAGKFWRTFYLLVAPTGVRLISTSTSQIILTWDQIVLANQGIEVCVSTSSSTSGFNCRIVYENQFTNSAAMGVTYYVKVRGKINQDSIDAWTPYSSVVAMNAGIMPPVLNADSGGYDRVTLSWGKVTGALGYEVYQSSSASGTYVLLTTTASTSYVKTGLITNTAYYYKIRAYLISGTKKYFSAYSTIVSSRPIPATPSVIAASVSYNSLKITWPTVSGSTGYEVSYSKSITGPFTVLPTMLVTSYTLTSQEMNVPVYLKVRAYRLVGTTKVFGSYSSIVNAKPIPSTPVLTVASYNYKTLRISWPAVLGVNGYELYTLNASTGLYELLYEGSETMYLHPDLISGVNHSYKVKAYSLINDQKIYSNESTIVTNKSIPSVPVVPKATSTSYSSISISYAAVEGATGYEIHRSTAAAGTYVLVTSTASLSYLNSSLAFNTTYFYKVRAYTLVGATKIYGNYTAVVSGKTSLNTPVINPVSSGYDRITITWPIIPGITKYELYQATSSAGIYTLLTSTTATNYTKTGLITNTSYYYKVRAYRLVGTVKYYSSYSTVTSARPIPATPSVTVVSASYNSLKASWVAIPGANGYELSYTKTLLEPFTVLPTQTVTSYTLTNQITDGNVYFRVRAYRLVGTTKIFGSYSVVASAKPIPTTPAVSFTSLSYKSLKLSWAAITGAQGYEVYHLENALYVLVQDNASLNLTVDELISGSTHAYKVVAYTMVNDVKIYSKEALVSGKVIPTTPSVSSVINYNSIRLIWNPIEGAIGYEIHRATTVSGTYALMTTVSATEYTHSSLLFNTSYFYKVRAYVLVNDVKIYSNFTGVLTLKTNVAAPIATIVSTSYISATLSWPAVTGATGYEVSRSTSLTGTYTILSAAQSGLSYANTGLITNTLYFYRVRAYRLISTVKFYSPYSVVVSVRPVPSKINGLVLSPNSHDSIKASWTALIGSTGYEVYASEAMDGSYTLKATVTTNSAVVTGFATETAVYIKVRAYRLVGVTKIFGDYSAVSSGYSKLTKPTVSATVVDVYTLQMSWSQVAGATGYKVYWFDKLNYELVIDTTSLSYLDEELFTGQAYEYKIVAYKKVGEQTFLSDPVIIKGTMIVPKPANLRIDGISNVDAYLSWDDAYADGYEVYTATVAAGPYKFANSSDNTSSWISPLTFNTTYYFKVRAYVVVNGKNIYGDYSAVISGKTNLSWPSVSLKATTNTSISIEWLAVNSATSYEVYRSTSAAGTYTLLSSTTALSYTNSALSVGSTYYYKVRAVKTVSTTKYYSAYSPVFIAVAAPVSPTNFAVISYNTNSVTLEWNTAPGASGYELSESLTYNGVYTAIYSGSNTSYQRTGLQPNETHFYKIRSYVIVNNIKYYGLYLGFSIEGTAGIPAPIVEMYPLYNQQYLFFLSSYDFFTYNIDHVDIYAIDILTDERTLVGSFKDDVYVFVDDYQGIVNKTIKFVAVCVGLIDGELFEGRESVPMFATLRQSRILDFNASAPLSGGVNLSWMNVSNTVEIYRSESLTGPYEMIASGVYSTGEYHDATAVSGKDYFYRVRRVSMDAVTLQPAYSIFSDIVHVTLTITY